MMPMRLPVTMSRRCVQMTALGESDVPDVKIRPNSAIGPGLDAGIGGRDPGERVVEVAPEPGSGRRRARGVAGLGKPARHEHGRQLAHDRFEQRLVAGFGDDEPAVRVLDVAQEVLAAPRVVQADDRGAGQRGATEREEVVGGVVEQHRRRAARRRARRVRRRGRGRGWPSGRHSATYSPWVHERSSKRTAGRSRRSGSSAFRRSNAAASGAGIGA